MLTNDSSVKKILVLGSGAIKIGEAGESRKATVNSTTPEANASRQFMKMGYKVY